MANRQVEIRRKDNAGGDYLDWKDTPTHSITVFGTNQESKVVELKGGFSQWLGNRQVYSTNFMYLPATTVAAATEDPLIIEGGAGTEVVTRSATGGVNMATDASDNSEAYLTSAANTGPAGVAINATSNLVFATRIKLGATITLCIFAAGLSKDADDVDISTITDGCFFFYDPALHVAATYTGVVTNWILATNVAGAMLYVDSGVAVAASTEYELLIEIDSERKPNFYINGTYISKGAALTDAATVQPFVGIQNGTTSARSYDCRYIAWSRALA